MTKKEFIQQYVLRQHAPYDGIKNSRFSYISKLISEAEDIWRMMDMRLGNLERWEDANNNTTQ